MYKFDLERVWCLETEDTWSRDEMRIDVFTDGRLVFPSIRRKMDNPEGWAPNHSFLFEKQLELQIWDEDKRDEDDLIGTKKFRGRLLSHQEADYTEEGGHYRIRYSIKDINGASSETAQNAINSFERSDKPGIWSEIDKAALISDLKNYLGTTELAKQGGVPLCGPASIVYEFSRRNPYQYVRICQQLYEDGKFKMRTKSVEPSETLLRSRKADNTHEAGWIVMASLRDVANNIFDIDHNANVLAGMTNPWEMKSWAFELLGYNWVDVKNLWFDYGEMNAMRKAHRIWANGGVAFLAVDSDLPYGRPGGGNRSAQHWITYDGELLIDEDKEEIGFKCFTWGRHEYPHLAKDSFKHQTWYIVYGAQRKPR